MQNGKDTLSVLLNTKFKSGDKVSSVLESSMYRDYFTKYDISILPENRQIFYSCLLAELVIRFHEPNVFSEPMSSFRTKKYQFKERERDVLKNLTNEIQRVKESLEEEV